MKILIVGGGIGGLAVTRFLADKGFDVTLIEQAPEFKHIGFGMSIFSNGRKILQELGIDDEVSKGGYKVPWLRLAYPDGKLMGEKIDFLHLKRFGAPVIIIERAVLHDALVKNLPKVRTYLGTTMKSAVNHENYVEVILSNGVEERFDLVIAADGIHSEIRKNFFGPNASSFYDWSVRSFWAPLHASMPEGAICLAKEGTILALYPMQNKSLVVLYEYNPKKVDHPPVPIEDFVPYLLSHGWTREDIEKIQTEGLEGAQFYDHLYYIALGKWYEKRIVLLGDACHGVSPITGMGASMALEDAVILADELGKVDAAHIEKALQAYSARRGKRIKQMRSLTDLVERFYFVTSPIQCMVRNWIVRMLSARFFTGKLERILEAEI